MNKTALPAALLAAGTLCGCTEPTSTSAESQYAPASYSCRATDGSGAHRDPRMVTITRDPNQARLSLTLEHGPTEILDAVASSSGRLYADAEFAWRIADDRSVLTDVENIQTYACRPVVTWAVTGGAVTR